MSIKVLHITTSYKGGAGIAAYRLHLALQDQGVSSGYLSRGKTIGFNGVEHEDDFLKYKKPSIFQILRHRLFPSKKLRRLQYLNKIKEKLQCEVATFPIANISLHEHSMVQDADIIHLHWIGGILDYPTFFTAINKPIVWTLHDMNPFMGIFHFQHDAFQNKEITSLASEMLDIKIHALRSIKKGALVSPSSWLLEEAKLSKVFSHFNEHTVIANGVDTAEFTIADKMQVRERFNISEKEHVLLFVAGSLDLYRKGFDLLEEALSLIDSPITLLTVGKGIINIANKQVKIVPLGFLKTPQELAAAYSAADVFVLPSREDNLPNTMLESFACGTPIISFAVGGMKEHIIKETNGMLAQEISAKALANTIVQFFEKGIKTNPEAIRAYAETHFSFKKQAQAYTDIYNSIIQ